MPQTITLRIQQVVVAEDDSRLVLPEPGDPVTITIEGRVEAVTGDQVTIYMEMANGEPVPDASKSNPDQELETEDAQLRQLFNQNRS